jgi:hypothetical protein
MLRYTRIDPLIEYTAYFVTLTFLESERNACRKAGFETKNNKFPF